GTLEFDAIFCQYLKRKDNSKYFLYIPVNGGVACSVQSGVVQSKSSIIWPFLGQRTRDRFWDKPCETESGTEIFRERLRV
ncbi:hypothetical protein J6590_103947, partial [Homalodisca vitripennis]